MPARRSIISLPDALAKPQPRSFPSVLDLRSISSGQSSDDRGSLRHLETLGAFVKEGKVPTVSLSTDTAWSAMKMLAPAEKYGLPRIASLQNEYNFFNRAFNLNLAEVNHHEMSARRPSFRQIPDQVYATLAREHGLALAQMQPTCSLSHHFTNLSDYRRTSVEQLMLNTGAKDGALSADMPKSIARDTRCIRRQFEFTSIGSLTNSMTFSTFFIYNSWTRVIF